MFDGAPLSHEPTEPWRSMREKAARRALLHDRLKALGAFTAIAIGGVAGFEMIIGGGFDSISLPPEVREVAPSNYVTVHQASWFSDARVVPLSSTEPLFAGDFFAVDTPDNLAGGYDDASVPDAGYTEVSEAEVRAEIDALYASDSAYGEASPTYQETSDTSETTPDPYAAAEAMVKEALGDYDLDTAPLHPL
jgi:hypothetical protein